MFVLAATACSGVPGSNGAASGPGDNHSQLTDAGALNVPIGAHVTVNGTEDTNAMVASFDTNLAVGGFSHSLLLNQDILSFAPVPSESDAGETVVLNIAFYGPPQVMMTYPVSATSTATGMAAVTYSQPSGYFSQMWHGSSGTARILSLTTDRVSVEVTGAIMDPLVVGVGTPPQGSFEISLIGSGVYTGPSDAGP